MRKRDRIQPLFKILASGDAAELRQKAKSILKEIQDEQNKLSRDAKLIRELINRYGGSADNMTPSERSARVREAALVLARSGKAILTPQDVVAYLEDGGTQFSVNKPGSVVGTVLAGMKDEFERLEQNQFRFKGDQSAENGDSQV